MSSNHLVDRIRRQLNLWQAELGVALWQENEPLVLAVSGGADSLAMLHLFTKGGLHSRDKIIAAHLDHMLRPESSADARIVEEICREWGIACETGTADVARIAAESRQTIEQAARSARYEFLGQVAARSHSRFIVVGHTRDDQAETVLMHLVRGSGTRGLRGMKPIRSLPGTPSLTLVRPLLGTSRAQVEAYCAAHQLSPLTDPTNQDPAFFRNRVRHELLPQLEELNPQIRDRLSAMAEVVRADVDYLALQTLAALKATMRRGGNGVVHLDRALWRQLPLSLRRRTLRTVLRRLDDAQEVGYLSLEQARQVAESGEVGAKSSLPGDLTLLVDYKTIAIGRAALGRSHELPQLEVSQTLDIPGVLALDEQWLLEARLMQSPDQVQFDDDPLTEYVDAGRVGQLLVRTRQPGDRIQPLGMDGQSAKVSDLMINRRIPKHLRARLPIVGNEEYIVWVVGVGIDERARIHSGTKRVLQLISRRRES